MKNEKKRKRLRLLLWADLVLVLVCAACIIAATALADSQTSQKAYERWAGDGDTDFAQVSCYLPENKKLTLNDIYQFKQATRDKLHEAALDIDTELELTNDCWSTVGTTKVTSDRGTADVSVIAVGGDFFSFHPLRLVSGNYLRQSDIMKDRIVIDRELAWRLFGGCELQGMTVYIEGQPFVIAGVIEREDDYASKKAYTAGMGLFMSYEAYNALYDEGIGCYEVVMPEPIDGFAYGVAEEKFPVNGGEIIENSGRFAYGRLMKLAVSFSSRSMQTLGVIYPYWENAARCIEDWCARLVMLATLAALIPCITVAAAVIKLIDRGREVLSDKYIPKIRDSAEEKIRVSQRRRWEKKHGKHEKRR